MTSAPHAKPAEHSDEDFWIQWLRQLMWLTIFVAGADLLFGLLMLGDVVNYVQQLNRIGGTRITPRVLIDLAAVLAPPLGILLAAVNCMKRRPGWRQVLIMSCWLLIALRAYQAATVLWYYRSSWTASTWLGRELRADAYELAFPAMLLWALSRQPLRKLFIATPAGFDVLPAKPPNSPHPQP